MGQYSKERDVYLLILGVSCCCIFDTVELGLEGLSSSVIDSEVFEELHALLYAGFVA